MQFTAINGKTNPAPSVRIRALTRISLIALTAALLSSEAHAQSASAATDTSIEQVVVTGSLISRPGYAAPTPVTAINAADLAAAAPQNVADYVNELPALSGSATPTSSTKGVSSGVAGQNTLNLRNLGSSRTLVLFDGQRSVGSSLSGTADLNNFPQALISRVDVVTGGASATYGSDAVAGVVNFILDKNYTGIKGDFSKGQTTYGDDSSWTASLTVGTDFAGSKGHFLLSADAAHTDGFVSRVEGYNNKPRPWAEQGWKIMNNPNYTATNGQPKQLVLNHVGIATAAYGGIIVSGPLKGTVFGPGGTPSQFNYGPLVSGMYMQGGDWRSTDTEGNNSLDSELNRQSVFTRVSYNITPDLQVYLQASYAYSWQLSINSFETQFGGLFINPITNPFVPAATAARAAALGQTSIEVGSMNGDLPPYAAGPQSRSVYRYVAGAAGDFHLFGTEVDWDGYLQDGVSHVNSTANSSLKSHYNLAIQAVKNPTTGAIVCASTLANPTNGCVPYNLFGTGVNTPEAINYLEGTAHMDSRFFQDVAAVNFRSEPLSDWAGPISLAVGASHRREATNATSTVSDQTQDFFAGNYIPTIGSYTVDEGYLETIIPLLKDEQFAKELSLDLAARATNYSVSGYVTTWKVSVSYSPIDDLRFRGTLSRDIRAPNLGELYTAGSTSTSSYNDPFMVPQTSYTAFTLSQGNLLLKPEKAQSTDLGLVYQPSWLNGFSASVDYFRVAVKNGIGGVATGGGKGQNIIDQCFQGNTSFCSLIIRGGPVLNGQSKITFVNQGNLNLAAQTEDGVDISTSYTAPMDSLFWGAFDGVPGTFRANALVTGTFKDITFTGVPGDIPRELAGTNSGGGPVHWRYLATLGWTVDPWDFTLTARGVSAGKYDNSIVQCTSGCPASTANNITQNINQIDGAFYLDANIAYNFKLDGADTQIYFNVKNVTNLDPPLVAGGPSGTTFTTSGENATLYDTLGRLFRAGVRFKM
jgi:outer membrane receptor protein involved in Fe transport